MEKIYLDHAATSPMHPDVIRAMVEYMENHFGNPSSIHTFGRDTRRLIDEARTTAARAIQAEFQEIVFTSGGTEANNLALIGVALANRDRGKHIITTQIEHHAVLKTCEFLEKQGFEVTYLPVNKNGVVSVEELQNSLRDDTILVSIMYANNEIGTVQPIAEIGTILSNHPAYFHTDAVQAFGVMPLDVRELGVDLLSVSAHKFNGPKGTGFLYIKDGVRILPIIHGGEQERKRRAGTENVAGIIGMQKAIKISMENRKQIHDFYAELRDTFIETLMDEKITFKINGEGEKMLPHIVNIHFPGVEVEAMLVNLDLAGIAASSGSACTAGSLEPSHVLSAVCGADAPEIYESIRFSFGYGNTIEEVQKAARTTAAIVRRLSR